jgi:uncharacterized coiled-coil DUF342 family protein
MRYTMILVVAVILTITAGAAPTSPSKDEMEKIYAENLRLRAESDQLDKKIVELNLQIEKTKKAIANLQYVEAENNRL